jgi:hypothetical protein
MASELLKFKKRKKIKSELDRIYDDAKHALVIHYSCESFYDIKDGRTPRVTTIAIRNLDSAQTESFSIHKIAERNKVDIKDIPTIYDALEKEMLSDFFDFIRCHQLFHFIHWNMRDGNYGFSAIEHRFQVLGGEPIRVPDDKKFDLARSLPLLYGRNYVGHGDSGKFLSLVELNDLTRKEALSGREEAQAFENAEYIKLHQSTLRKVDCISRIVERTVDGSLRTESTWKDRYGIHPKVIIEYIQNHWVWSLVVMITVMIGLLGKLRSLL